MSLLFAKPPSRVCLLRLSAIGDIVQVAAVAHIIRHHSPQTQLTWIIGKAEYQLLDHLEGIEFILFDKKYPVQSYLKLAKKLAARRFDALLLMQYSLRASLLSSLVTATVRIGYPAELSRELHGLFINHRVDAVPRTHKLDAYLSFAKILGIKDPALEYPPYYLREDAEFAQHHLPKDKKVLLIAPCASRSFKNWPAARYVEVAKAATERYDMQVVLSGTDSRTERLYESQIQQQLNGQCLSLIGKTNLKQLAAIVAHSDVVLAPDSAAVHIASALNIPVIGLYAATNPERIGPYQNRDRCVNCYPEALQKQYRKSISQVHWGKQIKRGGVMELISPAQVIQMLEHLLARVH